MQMIKMYGVAAAVVAGMVGCSSGGGTGPAVAGEPAGGVPSAASSAPVSSVPVKQAMTAAQVLGGLRKAGVPIKTTAVYTEETDPNSKLGRPGQYISKAACSDSRVPKAKIQDRERGSVEYGCDVEVFAEPAQAAARSKYILTAIEGTGGLIRGEYHWLRGGVLVRVTYLLTPKQAQTYRTALNGLPL